jgi:hypothetical protein
MKHTKSILVAALAVAAIGSASAAVTNNVPRNQFFIAGSTALRHVTMPTIYNYAVGDQGYSLQCADSTLVGTIGNNPKVALFSKEISRVTNAKSGDVTVTKDYINVHMIGSEGGTLVTGSKNVQGFAPLGSSSITESGCTNSNSATITFSDVDQAAGNFTGAKGAWAKVAKLTEVGQIAAINFCFVASSNFPASNITAQQAKALYSAGYLPLSFFTGNDSDRTNGVFATGRDIDSGTRVTTFSEIGLGASAAVQQYAYNGSNGISLTPAGTINGVTYAAGMGGENSGGTLCTLIATSGSQGLTAANVTGCPTNITGKVYLMGYTSTADASTKTLKVLSYNGFTPYYSSATSNGFQNGTNGIINGQYSFWSTGRLLYNAANAPKGTDKTLVPTVATAIYSNLTNKTTANFLYGYTALSDLKVQRVIEGAKITPKN